ncbi:MAG: S8 family serine peptidase [Candidatus Andeanibacterium colombiense]|uniref:S8 family serine peptidase n=1 Tax=Candidatus Andeanibacterium colombiense TaxID=3121345 RepID=A0AAJ5XBT0_9SPHN|nr:MAG: S8 family serine peptidase [Sphingomonadaceae bacterium]
MPTLSYVQPVQPVDTIGYKDSEYNISNGPRFHGAATAWVGGHTGQGTLIGIIDTGIFQGNSEFAGRISSASTDIFSSRGTVQGEGTHGTEVAMVAAAANDGAGSVGIAYSATILSIRSDTPGSCAGGECTFGDVSAAIDYAVTHNATVINMSLGGSSASQAELAAIQRAEDAGIVVVIAAGNDGKANPDVFAATIAAKGFDNVIIAGSVGPTGAISSFSDKAGTSKAYYLSALGERVSVYLSGSEFEIDPDYSGAGYYAISGTSFSAPQIAAAVALLKQAFPTLTAAEIVQLLFESAQDVGASGVDAIYGNGIMDISRAFQPLGTTSLAGKTTASIALGDTSAVGSPAMGDALQNRSIAAVVLDKYQRAFTTDIGVTMRSAVVATRLYNAVGTQSRFVAAGNDDASTAFTIDGSRMHFGDDPQASPLSLSFKDAQVARVLAARVAVKLAPDTKLGFTYSEGSNGLVMQLQGQDRPAFMIAQQAGSDDGSYHSDAMSFALRKQFGSWGLTVAGTSGQVLSGNRVWLLNQTFGSRTDDAVSHMVFTADRRWGGLQATLGLDWMDEQRTVLGGRFHQAFGGGGAQTMFVDATANWEFAPGLRLGAAFRNGWTYPQTSSVIESGSVIQSRAWSLDVEKRGVFAADDGIALRVSQPLRVESGGLNLSLPVAYSYDTESATMGTIPLSLTPDGREIMSELAWHGSVWGGGASASLFFRRDPGNYATLPDDAGVALRWRTGF